MIISALLMSIFIPITAGAAPPPELVLRENVRLSATTSTGIITITTGKGLERTYSWDDCSLSAHMGARDSRWFGSLSIYDAAHGFGEGATTSSCHGISRTVVEEGQIHFANITDAKIWIQRFSQDIPTVWSKDGLVVRWSITPQREQINVDVWQICIAGKKPTALAGADGKSIHINRTGPGASRFDCSSVDKAVYAETLKSWQEQWKFQDDWKSAHSQ